jgi:anthranilate synthase/aminodeoxychorismate synthase-like glutamine amidotransferase
MILVVDNADSFTFNLVQMLRGMGERVAVRRSHALDWRDMEALEPSCVLISPGPGGPEEAGLSMALIRRFGRILPILGVCLGHQAIAAVYGARVVRAQHILHGKTSRIHHDGRTIFRDMPEPFAAGRYHSLIVAAESLPDCLEASAWTRSGEIMGVRHREFPVEGIQFHPESVLTPLGEGVVRNFVRRAAEDQGPPIRGFTSAGERPSRFE